MSRTIPYGCFCGARGSASKKRCSLLSKAAPMSPAGGGAGGRGRPGLIHGVWCSLTRPGSRPAWPRVVDGFAPHGHWRTLTFLGALRCDRLTAPCVFEGPINGECFRAYVEQQLVPVLKPGDIVIMDNLGSHKSAVLRRILKTAGARLWYLPPYSPDLNPIKQAFAKIKHRMRAAQKRTVEDTWRHIGSLLETIPPNECNNYFGNAGYASIKM
jgi:transposase